MSHLSEVPNSLIASLSQESAVKLIRSLLDAECHYCRISPATLTISSRITVADGGIDSEVNAPLSDTFPSDGLFQAGLTGFQIKSGTAFKPWTKNSIRNELLDSKGNLASEVERLTQQSGRYTLICTGHDLTSKQRNQARNHIASVLSDCGHADYDERIDVLGADHIAQFVERHIAVASSLVPDPIQEAWTLDTWRQDAHLSSQFEASDEQSELIAKIRASLFGVGKHVRVLGEPGLGKTRIVLEAVQAPNLAPCVLYFPHGSQFGQTKLFRHLLRSVCDKPLILVIDELPESELIEIWRHLKTRCGALKIVSLDHGRDKTRDEEIERLYAPKLSDETVKRILARRIGESRELDRWVEICEGSPRVAQAVAENLQANPEDLLRPPATVPLWERFLHGYGKREELQARQVDCVARHLALFSRFGYEAPVSDEARHIAAMIETVDPTIGWARFQEIVQSLRDRRVLQGGKTLFFVPRALHIFLWRGYWESYAQDFRFADTFTALPKSLLVWFLKMFKYADEAAAAYVVRDILKPDGIYSDKAFLTCEKGARFLSDLAEADPPAVLRLLETTLGRWSDDELAAFSEHRQHIVWTLEKIAVWAPQTIRALRLLAKLALNETANWINNATGTLFGLFRIGPEHAATEAAPCQRLPAALELLRAGSDAERELGLGCIATALDTSGMAIRMVGAEFQGLKARAKLWIPDTYGDWWDAHHVYFRALVEETRSWPEHLRPKVCSALLKAVEQVIALPPCTEPALATLETLAYDPHMNPSELNRLFCDWSERCDERETKEIRKRIDAIGRAYVRRDIKSRFQRYVIDIDYLDWHDENPRNRAPSLVNALAKRAARRRESFEAILSMLAPKKHAHALGHFGQQLAIQDPDRVFLPQILNKSLEAKDWSCLSGYLYQTRTADPGIYQETIRGLLSAPDTAWLGVELSVSFGYDELLFSECLDALEFGRIGPEPFSKLVWGNASRSVSAVHMARLLRHLHSVSDEASMKVLIELLAGLGFDDTSPFVADLAFDAITRYILDDDHKRERMDRHTYSVLCKKLIAWKPEYRLPLLAAFLKKMAVSRSLIYDDYCIVPIASELIQADPAGAWLTIREHIERPSPKSVSQPYALLFWLKGSIGKLGEQEVRGPIADLPLSEILSWIDEDPPHRARLIAHAAPGTLDDKYGGQLTRELLARYPNTGAEGAIASAFHSCGWSGPESEYLKRRRNKFREWLSMNFHCNVAQWIERELEDLDRRIERTEMQEERDRYE